MTTNGCGKFRRLDLDAHFPEVAGALCALCDQPDDVRYVPIAGPVHVACFRAVAEPPKGQYSKPVPIERYPRNRPRALAN